MEKQNITSEPYRYLEKAKEILREKPEKTEIITAIQNTYTYSLQYGIQWFACCNE